MWASTVAISKCWTGSSWDVQIQWYDAFYISSHFILEGTVLTKHEYNSIKKNTCCNYKKWIKFARWQEGQRSGSVWECSVFDSSDWRMSSLSSRASYHYIIFIDVTLFFLVFFCFVFSFFWCRTLREDEAAEWCPELSALCLHKPSDEPLQQKPGANLYFNFFTSKMYFAFYYFTVMFELRCRMTCVQSLTIEGSFHILKSVPLW